MRALVQRLLALFGRTDVVVSYAAAYQSRPITELDDDAWTPLRATNIAAFFYLAKAALPHLAASRGNLVAVSSVSGDRGD